MSDTTVSVAYAANALRQLDEYIMSRTRMLAKEITLQLRTDDENFEFPLFCSSTNEMIRILSDGSDVMSVSLECVTSHDEPKLVFAIDDGYSNSEDVYIAADVFDDETRRREFIGSVVSDLKQRSLIP